MTLFDLLSPPSSLNKPVSGYDPVLTAWLAETFMPVVEAYFRFTIDGLEHLPNEPFVGVGVHGGGLVVPESVLWVGKYHLLKRKPQLIPLAHKQLFNPVFGYGAFLPLMKRLGVMEASVENASKLLNAGYAVQVYPGGDLDAFRPFSKRNQVVFGGRQGYVRLALRAGKPLLPVASIGGSETNIILSDGSRLAKALGLNKWLKVQVAPLSWSYPNGLSFGLPKLHFPLPAQISMCVLPPVYTHNYDPKDADRPEVVAAIDQQIRTQLQKKMDQMAKGRIPIIGKIR